LTAIACSKCPRASASWPSCRARMPR
jgi:hypothetical protein